MYHSKIDKQDAISASGILVSQLTEAKQVDVGSFKKSK